MEMQSRKYTVELLQLEDIPWFVEVAGFQMLRDELQRPELYNQEHLYNLTYKAHLEKTAFVVKVDGECVGAIGGLLLPNMFNPLMTTLAELVWFVLPDYRHTRVGAMLIKAFDGLNVSDETTLSLLPTSEVNVKTMEKIGFNLEEYGFRKRNK